MNGEGKIVEFRQRDKRFESPLPLSDFYTKVRHCLFAIREAQNKLWDAYRLFWGGSDIWRDQCEHATDSVQLISQPIHQFYLLLLNTAQIPEDIAPFRYPLMILLYRMDEQARKLIQLLTEFRAICRKASKQRTRQRHVIEELLAELTQNCDEVQQRTHIFFNHMNQIAAGTYPLRGYDSYSRPTVRIGYGPLTKMKQGVE